MLIMTTTSARPSPSSSRRADRNKMFDGPDLEMDIRVVIDL